MCGIAGVYYHSDSRPVDPEVLGSMAAAMTHRGPDDQGFHRGAGDRLGLAFRRLSIVDLAGGHQPMSTPDGRYTLVFNGEVYNHLELRKELESLGVVFSTRCDTEVILHAYAVWGEDCLRRFQGMFALGVWDEEERTLFLARDRMGIKPLYWAPVPGGIAFGSEIKVLFRHPDLSPALERNEMARYLTFLCVPPPNTLFEGVNKLAPGHSLVIRENDGPGTPRSWWSSLPEAGYIAPERSLDDWAEELRELLVDSVRARLMADVPFGAFLSGGVDSSAIVAIMSSLLDRPVETFTVGYKDDPGFNELEHARATAKRFGTNHHEVMIDHADFRDFLPRLVHHQDEPIADPVCVPLYHVAELARRNGVLVTQVGEGADELFFGYSFHNRIRRLVERWWNPLSRFPRPIRSAAVAAMSPLVDIPVGIFWDASGMAGNRSGEVR